jgi:PDDEXK-like domain of unknown function (DUF3799)
MTATISTLEAFDPALAFGAGAPFAPQGEPGRLGKTTLFRDLPAEIYHGDRDYLSCSMLKPLLDSPANFLAALTATQKPSDARDFGTLVHGLVLEPKKVNADFAVYPGIYDGRSKDYKEFVAANPGRLVVDEPTFSRGRSLADRVLSRVVRGRPFGDFVREGVPEASIYFEEPTTGTKLRIRVDLYHPEANFDLKTTRRPDVRSFLRDAIDMHYDLQGFMYTLGCALHEGTDQGRDFVFVAVETEAPHSISTVTLDAGCSMLSNGAKKFQEVLTLYHACKQVGLWPDLSGDVRGEIDHWQAYQPRNDWRAMLSSQVAAA